MLIIYATVLVILLLRGGIHRWSARQMIKE